MLFRGKRYSCIPSSIVRLAVYSTTYVRHVLAAEDIVTHIPPESDDIKLLLENSSLIQLNDFLALQGIQYG